MKDDIPPSPPSAVCHRQDSKMDSKTPDYFRCHYIQKRDGSHTILSYFLSGPILDSDFILGRTELSSFSFNVTLIF
jgi:hypothetical protein